MTGLLFSEDTQLDIPSSQENNIPASAGGRGEAGRGLLCEDSWDDSTAESLVSEERLIHKSSEKQLQEVVSKQQGSFGGMRGQGEATSLQGAVGWEAEPAPKACPALELRSSFFPLSDSNAVRH